MKTLHILLLIAIIGMVSCNSDIKNTPEYKEVIAIHDEIMPEIDVMHDIKNEFKSYADSTNLEMIRSVTTGLVSADDAMMKWMDEFKLPEDKSEAMNYLALEKEKIQAIANQMKTAKENATKMLETLKANKK